MGVKISLSIRKVLLVVMAFMLLTVGMVEAFRYVMAEKVANEIMILTTENRQILDKVEELQNIVADIQRLAFVSVIAQDEDAFQQVAEETKRFVALVEKVSAKVSLKQRLHTALAELKDTFKGYVGSLHSCGVLTEGEHGLNRGQLVKVEAFSRALNKELFLIHQVVDAQARQQVDSIQKDILDNFFLALFFLLPLPIVVAWAFFFLEKNLTRPFQGIMFFVREQIEARPDLSQRLNISNRGEMGVLAQGLNKLLDTLEQTTVSYDHLLVEIGERKKVESDLRSLQEKLEDLVIERTKELQDEVTHRHQAEIEQFKAKENLRESLDYVHSIVNNLPVCVKLIDKQGQVLDINSPGAVLFGADNRKAVIGQSIYPFIAEDDREQFRRFNEKICAGEEGEINFTLNTLKGKDLQMVSMAVPLLYGETGEVVQLGIARDVTEALQDQEEKEKLRDQLRHVQKLEAMGTLAGGIAHDFNNILAGVIGFAELAALDAEKDSRQAQDIEEIIKAGARAKELVTQMRALSRRGDNEFIPYRIQVILKEGVKLLRSSLPSTIKIQQDIDQDCKPVFTDPAQIHQVLMNLATNSFHAMDNGGVLKIGLQQIEISGLGGKNFPISLGPGSYVRLTVSDTGAGMDQVTLKRIFEPYFTTKGMEKGTGLGLAVILGIVQSHGGDIKVFSEVGKGSAFHVYLPCVAEDEPSVNVGAKALPTGSERIMVVDDEEVNLHMMERVLAGLGYEVDVFSSSMAALDAFQRRSESYDLLITDMTMPEMTGEELSANILEIRDGMAIILCTGFSEAFTEDKVKEMGARGYLMKPFGLKDLADIVRKVLDGN